MPEKHVVTVSRQWDNPEIAIDISTEGIGIRMALDDFVTALIVEVGSPTLILRQSTFEDRVRAAARRVVTGMKEETAKVV